MEHIRHETLFLNPDTILFIAETEVPDDEHFWSEFEFRATDFKADAWLTYNHEDETWSGRIQTTQRDDGFDDDPEPAEPDQVAVLLAKLPEAELAKIPIYTEACKTRSTVAKPRFR